MDVFWLSPNLTSRQEGGGKVWFNAEVLYTILSSEAKDKVNEVSLFHCQDGQVQIDTVTKNMQMGCPAHPTTYRMIRTE